MIMQPDSIAYRVAYDVAEAGNPDWWLPALGLAASLAFAYQLVRFWRAGRPMVERLMLFCGILLGGALALVLAQTTDAERRWILGHLSAGRFEVVEGTVSNYQAGESWSHRPESWEVAASSGVHKYDSIRSQVWSGFRWAAFRGERLRSGSRVRITEVRGRIARIEVAR